MKGHFGLSFSLISKYERFRVILKKHGVFVSIHPSLCLLRVVTIRCCIFGMRRMTSLWSGLNSLRCVISRAYQPGSNFMSCHVWLSNAGTEGNIVSRHL